MKEKTQHIGQLIRQGVKAIDPNAEVILYGSRARGDEKPDSDWDILILVDYPVDISVERRFRHKLYDIEIDTGESLSIFVYSRTNWESRQRISPFYHNVSREGISL